MEQRGLAGAVGSDQRAPLAGGDAQRDAVDGAQPPEYLCEILDLDRGIHGDSPFALTARVRRRLTNPTMPSGAHRIVAMKTMPMIAA